MRHQNKLVMLAICAVFVCFAATAFAMVVEESVVGEVVNSSSGYAIATDSGWYLVDGYDVSGLLGKKVKVTGGISEEDGSKTIHVTSVEEIK